MLLNAKALFKPNMYHGWGKTKRYFEGWYYKLINAKETEAIAVIPGIAMNENGSKQAFVQVLDGKKLKAYYHKFDAKSFIPSKDSFALSLGKNQFSIDRLDVNLPNLSGVLKFKNHYPWPSTWFSPGIMGPFSFVPFMQCYHGILSMNHEISGEMNLNERVIDFNGGKGYIEKDWGRSFPEAYIWMQSNHFDDPSVSFKASVAKIPWMGTSFVGFIAGFLIDEKLIQFTTYNFSKLRKSHADENVVELQIESPSHRLSLHAKREAATSLASPILGFMDGRIEESMTAILNVQVYDKKNKKTIFEGAGRNGGLEVAGDIKQILI